MKQSKYYIELPGLTSIDRVKEMSKTGFLSFEEFVMLPDSFICGRNGPDGWGVSMSPYGWQAFFIRAKQSWEKYGDDPPIGATVMVMVNGHGTSFPSTRDLIEGYLPTRTLEEYEKDERFFSLLSKDGRSLAEKALWWHIFTVKD